MTKTTRRQQRPVERAPFHRGAYLYQWQEAAKADAFLAEHGESIPLIGTPETGSKRGSNRSEITPAFLYSVVRDVLPTDAGEPVTITTASGESMTVDELEALNAVPSIDSVSQHATTAHRDRRLMSRQSVTRTRYVGPCVARRVGGWDETGQRWNAHLVMMRARCDHAGRILWTTCPTPCPAACTAEHRHVRHQHREHGLTRVYELRPYGADGLDRGTAAWSSDGVSTQGRISKRQGRRTQRGTVGSWTDAYYQAGTADAVGAYVTTVPYEHDETRNGRTVLVRSWVKASREYVTLPAAWVRPPMVRPVVKVRTAPKAHGPASVKDATTLSRTQLRDRIASDPATVQLAGRILLAAEHAWSTNGQAVKAEHGLTLVVTLPPKGGPVLTITHGGSEYVGTYKARTHLVRAVVASLLTQ